MKIIAYWVENVFDMGKHWVEIPHIVTIELDDNTTDEDVEKLLHRRDLVRITNES